MKEIKIIVGLFIVTLLFALTGVNATVHKMVDIKIPNFNGVYKSEGMYKQRGGNHYVLETKSKDTWSGDERKIVARTNGFFCGTISQLGYTPWTTLEMNKNVELAENPCYNQYEGFTYKLELKATRTTASEATWSGNWTYEYN